jgi:multidrug transporter EmrE-like cation transporter
MVFAVSPGSGTLPMETRTVQNLLAISSSSRDGQQWPLALNAIAALAYYFEYVLNFIFVGYVSSMTFSVCDIARRVAIIATGAVVFDKPLTSLNWIGISVALGGVLWYSLAVETPPPAKK